MQFSKLTKKLVLSLSLLVPVSALAEDDIEAKLYKNPGCYCCDLYAKYLDNNGYEVEVIATDNLPAVKQQSGIPGQLAACHTTIIGDYVIEGHVPVDSIDRLLKEQPEIQGIAVSGMPAGSPGMGGEKTSPIVVYSFSEVDAPQVYETHSL